MTLHILLNEHMNTKLISSALWQNKLSYDQNSRKHTQYCIKSLTTAHPWCDGYSTSISVCGVWGAKAGVQISRRELHTHIHLDQAKVEFYLVSTTKKKFVTLHILLSGHILSYAKVHYDKINCHMKMNCIKHTHEENKRKHTH